MSQTVWEQALPRRGSGFFVGQGLSAPIWLTLVPLQVLRGPTKQRQEAFLRFSDLLYKERAQAPDRDPTLGSQGDHILRTFA